MKPSSLCPIVVLLALGTLAPWAVEGSEIVSIKSGACPPSPAVKCPRKEKPLCRNDWMCPGKQRCCTDGCSTKCLEPVAIQNPVNQKPGKCPVFDAECLMLNPPNRCESDSQCDLNFKCCKGMCGKVCMAPVKA